jgi:LuxR family maltose regulon positive regulatory protein
LGVQHTLTLVSAPPGFGKTTLLAEWAQATPLPVAWVSLDAGDNDLAHFTNDLVDALAQLQPALPGVQALQQNPPFPAQLLLEGLLRDLQSLSEQALLVLDDYHIIEQQQVQQGLAFLLEQLPANLHLLIASRSDPLLPLARWRGRGELKELRADDLRFTLEEAASFLEQMPGVSIDPASLEILEVKTEGWISGLQLAALSLQGRPDTAGFVRSFSGSHR